MKYEQQIEKSLHKNIQELKTLQTVSCHSREGGNPRSKQNEPNNQSSIVTNQLKGEPNSANEGNESKDPPEASQQNNQSSRINNQLKHRVAASGQSPGDGPTEPRDTLHASQDAQNEKTKPIQQNDIRHTRRKQTQTPTTSDQQRVPSDEPKSQPADSFGGFPSEYGKSSITKRTHKQ
jgi:hypothetical protein